MANKLSSKGDINKMSKKGDIDMESVSSNSSEDLRKREQQEPSAPDSGYAWVVLAASFMSSVIVDGVCFAFGIFLLEFLDYFREDRGKTAWVGSVLNGTYMIMGPIAGALANKFGCQKVAIIGGIWSSVAFFLATLSPNINVLIFTYGVLGGIGFGLMYLPSIVVVGFYFDRKRAFATGIATCGSGIGAFIFAPMCQALIDMFTWKGAQWIMAGIVLNGVVLGALYRPLTDRDMEYYRQKWRLKQCKKLQKKKQNNPSDDVDLDLGDDFTYFNGKEYTKDPKGKMTSNMRITDSWHSLSSYASVESLPKKCKQIGGASWDDDTTSLRKRQCAANVSWEVGGEQRVEGVDNKDFVEDEETDKESGVVRELLDNICSTLDVSMLKNPVFVIYGISCILCMAGFFVPFIYLPDHTISLGYGSSKAAFLLSILGITNTVGRIVTGWMSDRSWADCLMINNVALIVGGIATIICPFCSTYALLAMYACVFGLCIAAFVSLRSIILVDLIGLDKLTSSFGIIVLCQGLTSFVGAPFAGWLYDVTGTYDVSFYVAGTFIMLAGIINLPLRRLAKWRQERCSEGIEESC